MEMHLKVCFSFVVLLSTAGAEFSEKPNTQQSTCVGSNLHLDWTINGGSDISTVIWSFDGTAFATKSGINGAVTYIGSSIRATDVTHTRSGIIEIKNTAVADAGEYACSIAYTVASGTAPASSTATVAVLTAPLDPTLTTTGSTYTCSSVSTSVTVTIKVDNVDKETNTYTGSVDSSVDCSLSGYALKCRADSSGTEYSKNMITISQAGYLAPVIIGIIGSIYGTSWILAIVVLLVIYCTDQKRLPWNFCDGLLKNRWIWLLIFISVPFVTFVVAICRFITKRPGKPTKPVISPQSVSVNVGDKATFTCTSSSTTDQAESGPTMSYTWRRNGVDMKSEGRYMVSGQTLTVTNVVKGDAYDTLFTCLAREGSGLPSDESDPARIVIIGKPTKPVISPQSVSVNVGDTATFTCTSSSTTYPAQSGLTMIYTWRCNRVDMKSEGRYMVSGQTLTVTKVVKGDASDTFTCLAREGSGLTSDESDSARIVITKPTSWTKWGHYGASESESELILPFNE